MKQRTTIMLSPELKARAVKRARARGISFGELVRDSLSAVLDERKSEMNDSLFSDSATFSGRAPADLSAGHDRYLYDEK